MAKVFTENCSLTQWLQILEKRHWQEIDLGLKRIQKVAKKLQVLTPRATVIHIAGTNGKGSTCATLETLYLNAGYTVGVYTSPHLITCNERIRVNNHIITDTDLCRIFSIIENARNTTILTYFETFTLAALIYFQEQQLDVIILEVGMGGRLDATNIINNDIAIITTIDFDHQEYLGNSIEKISFEKTGICRYNQPCIYADTIPEVVINHCTYLLKCTQYFHGKNYKCYIDNNQLYFIYQQKIIKLTPPHLHINAIGSALMASIILSKKLPIDYNTINLDNINLAGRQQILKINDNIMLLDVAHNAQSAKYLAEYLRIQYPHKIIHAIFSALNDKDITALIAPLRESVNYWYPVTLNVKRGATPSQLQDGMTTNHIIIKQYYQTPKQAYHSACNNAASDDLIIVYGSFIIVGQILSLINQDVVRIQ